MLALTFTVNGTGRCYEYMLILKSNNYKSDLITNARGKKRVERDSVILDEVIIIYILCPT